MVLMYPVKFPLHRISQTSDMKLSQDVVRSAVVLQDTMDNKLSKFLNLSFVWPISSTFDLKRAKYHYEKKIINQVGLLCHVPFHLLP